MGWLDKLQADWPEEKADCRLENSEVGTDPDTKSEIFIVLQYQNVRICRTDIEQ